MRNKQKIIVTMFFGLAKYGLSTHAKKRKKPKGLTKNFMKCQKQQVVLCGIKTLVHY